MSTKSKLNKDINQGRWLERRGWRFCSTSPYMMWQKGLLNSQYTAEAVAIEKGQPRWQSDVERRVSTIAAAEKRKAQAEYEASLPQYLLDRGWEVSARGVWNKVFTQTSTCYKTLKQAVKLQIKLDCQETV